MKILKVLLISVFALIIVLVVAAVIFVKNFDVNRYKPQIISQAKNILNRQVDFQKANLALSLRQGISLKISNLVIAEDPAFGKDNFLQIKEVSLAVDVLAYILQKKVNVPNVLIDSPRLSLIRKKDGSLNVQTIAKPAQPEKEGAKSASIVAPMVLPALLISSLRAGNATVTYIDYSFEPALRLEISDLNLSIDKISLTESFPFVAEAAVLSSKKNIKLEGKAQIDLKTNAITISDLKARTDLSQILLEKIPAAIPLIKVEVLPISLKGNVDVALQQFTAGPKGLMALAADGSLTNASFKLNEMALPIKDAVMNVKITESKIFLKKLSANIGEGMINASGSIADYLSGQDYRIEANAQNLKIQDLITQDKSPVKAEGIAYCQLRFKGEGFTPQALSSNLSGAGTISVTEAKLKDINVLQTVLDKISVIPGLSERIQAGLPQRYKQKLTQADTVFSDIKFPVTIEKGRFVVKDTVLGADEFLFKGGAEAGFDGNYSLEGSFLIPQELSASMVAVVPELQYLLNEEKQIYIPLKISGRAGAPKFNVDGEYIAKRILANQAKRQILKAIDKALGQTEEPQPSGQNATEQNATTQDSSSKKPTTEEIVGSILGNIFK
jgi:uncharacterized protein involved in outer membrane biogenesis